MKGEVESHFRSIERTWGHLFEDHYFGLLFISNLFHSQNRLSYFFVVICLLLSILFPYPFLSMSGTYYGITNFSFSIQLLLDIVSMSKLGNRMRKIDSQHPFFKSLTICYTLQMLGNNDTFEPLI